MSESFRWSHTASAAVAARVTRTRVLRLAAATMAGLWCTVALAQQSPPAAPAPTAGLAQQSAPTATNDAGSSPVIAQAATPGAPVLAQTTSAPAPAAEQAAPSAELQEVVVTARYRQENLQQTPLSITAITAADMQQQILENVNDLGDEIPNAYFRQPVSNFGPTETIGLRGFTQTDFDYSFQPTVGVYVDDVYQGSLTGSSLDLADLKAAARSA